jgi:hypothetical protein
MAFYRLNEDGSFLTVVPDTDENDNKVVFLATVFSDGKDGTSFQMSIEEAQWLGESLKKLVFQIENEEEDED